MGRRAAFGSESMASDTTSDNLGRFLLELRPHFERIAQPDSSPYDAGRTVWATALGNRDCRDVSHALWLIWGALTDMVEFETRALAEAESKMRMAAREWLEISTDDAVARRQYFDRWIHEELGYEPHNC